MMTGIGDSSVECSPVGNACPHTPARHWKKSNDTQSPFAGRMDTRHDPSKVISPAEGGKRDAADDGAASQKEKPKAVNLVMIDKENRTWRSPLNVSPRCGPVSNHHDPKRSVDQNNRFAALQSCEPDGPKPVSDPAEGVSGTIIVSRRSSIKNQTRSPSQSEKLGPSPLGKPPSSARDSKHFPNLPSTGMIKIKAKSALPPAHLSSKQVGDFKVQQVEVAGHPANYAQIVRRNIG